MLDTVVMPGLNDLKFPQGHDPFPLYERMRGAAPFYDERNKCWLVSSYDQVMAVLAHPGFVSHRSSGSEGLSVASDMLSRVSALLSQQLLVIDGDEHRRLQRLIGPALQSNMYAIRQPLSEQVERLLAVVLPMEQWDVVRDLARPLSLWTMGQILGLPSDKAVHLDQLAQWADALASVTCGFVSLRAFEQVLAMKAAFTRWLADASVSPPEGLLNVFASQAEWRDDEERVANLMMLFTAGNVTTIKATVHGVWLLLRYPGQANDIRVALQQSQGDVRKQAAIMKPVVEQLLARVTPTRYIVRWATSEVEVGGKMIHAGEQVYLFLEGANSCLFGAEGEATGAPIDLCQRLSRPHVTFGVPGNPHYCIGAPLARQSIQAALISILLHFPALRLDPQAPPEWGKNANLGGLASLPVIHGSQLSQNQKGIL